MTQKLNALAVGYSLAILSGLCMLLLGILGNLGLYMKGVEAMQQWHLFFDLSVLGIAVGIVEAVVFSFAVGWLFAYLYNRLS